MRDVHTARLEAQKIKIHQYLTMLYQKSSYFVAAAPSANIPSPFVIWENELLGGRIALRQRAANKRGAIRLHQ